MRLQLRGETALIRPDRQPDKTESGLHIVYDRQESTMRGVVVALGQGPMSRNGKKRLPHIVTVGDKVIFSPDSGTDVIFEKETLVCLREDDILAVEELAVEEQN